MTKYGLPIIAALILTFAISRSCDPSPFTPPLRHLLHHLRQALRRV